MTTFANTAGYSTTFDALSPENSNPSYFSSENMADYRPFSQAGGGKRKRKRKRGQTQKASRGRQTVIAKNMCSCMDMLGSTEDVECTLICKSGSKTKTRKLRFKGSRGSSVVRSLLKGTKKRTTKKKKKKRRKKSKKAKMLRGYLGPADSMALDAVSAVGAEAGKQLGDKLSQGVSKATSYMPEIPKGPRFPKFGPPSDFEPHKLGSAELDVPDGDRGPPGEPSPMAEPTDDSPFDMEPKISDDYVDVKPPSGEEPSM